MRKSASSCLYFVLFTKAILRILTLSIYVPSSYSSLLTVCLWLIFNLRRSDHVLWRTHQPSLAACSWAYQIQSCRPGLQGPPRLCTVVPWPVHLRFQPSKSPMTSLFLQRLPRPASGSPLHCWLSSIFSCWPSGVELSTTGGYVGTVSGDLPHSTQDVPVHWHSVYLTFCVYTLSIVYLAIF